MQVFHPALAAVTVVVVVQNTVVCWEEVVESALSRDAPEVT